MLKKYIKKLFNNHKKTKNNYIIFLKDYTKKLTYIASALSNKHINILESKDSYGGYFKTTIILPKEIKFFQFNKQNYKYYIYKIIFFLYLNEIITKIKAELDYLIISFTVMIKYARKNIKAANLNISELEKLIYPEISKSNLNIKDHKSLFLNILIEKLIYSRAKYKIILTNHEKIYLYKLENLVNIKNKNLNYLLDKAYIYLIKLYDVNNNSEINHPWGYAYYHDDKIIKTPELKIQTNNIKKKYITKINININKKHTRSNKPTLPITQLFNYKKTIDRYNKNNNKTINNKDGAEIEYLNSTNLKTVTKNEIESRYLIKNDILNNSISYNNINNDDFKKYEYNEWDFNLDTYKKNWCKIYEKKDTLQKEHIWHKDYIKKHITIHKKLILLFKEKLLLFTNKKKLVKRQKYGQDIDLDTVIDNYRDVKNSTFDNVYTNKIQKKNETAAILLIDSSLSMDSYFNNIIKLSFIKNLVLLLSLILEKIIAYEVSTFHSNTRHDCRYLILKKFNDSINKQKFNILNILSSGYTRIGPALRHAANILNKRYEHKKIIILLTDGCPTDYDEYEGTYGIQDIKNAIIEITNKKIQIKNIITNDTPNIIYLNTLNKNNYTVINNISYTNIMKILTLCFNLKI